MLIMLSLSPCHFINEAHESFPFGGIPEFSTKSFRGSIATFTARTLNSSHYVDKFCNDRDDCVEVDHKGSTDEWDGVCQKLELPFGFGSDISVSDCACSHNESVEDQIIFSQRTFRISHRVHLIGQEDQPKEEVFSEGNSEEVEEHFEDSSERIAWCAEEVIEGLSHGVEDVDDLEEEESAEEAVLVGDEGVGEEEGDGNLKKIEFVVFGDEDGDNGETKFEGDGLEAEDGVGGAELDADACDQCCMCQFDNGSQDGKH